MGAALAQPGCSDAKMAARKPFGGYGPGSRRRAGKAEVKEDPVLKQLKDIWRKCSYRRGIDYDYPDMVEEIRSSGIEYSSEHVQMFLLALPGLLEVDNSTYFRCIKAGVFLSALINTGKDEEYLIRTIYTNLRLDFLGCRNTKQIRIEGDAGDNLGIHMEGGEIHVEGNAGSWIGMGMSGGEIRIDGDARDHIGFSMEGGRIDIKGRAGYYIGLKRTGGQIFIGGEIRNDGF